MHAVIIDTPNSTRVEVEDGRTATFPYGVTESEKERQEARAGSRGAAGFWLAGNVPDLKSVEYLSE
jgi:hypothetical protein